MAALSGVLVLGILGPAAIPAQARGGDCLLGLLGDCDDDEPPAPPAPPPDQGQPPPSSEPPPPPAPGDQPDGGAPAPGQPGPDGNAPVEGEGDGTATPPQDAGPFPANLRRQMNSVKRSGPSNTQGLVDALAPLGQFGVSPEQAALIGFGRFPVAGVASYVHDWLFPRFGPGWRLHQGTDIFASFGTPIRAPSDGTVRISNSGLGGLAVYVTEADGTFWYMAHMAGIADGIDTGTPVKVGQVVGFVGDSGNARGGAPHLHIELHPGGGKAVDGKATLDQFITDAIAGAPQLIATFDPNAAAANPALAAAQPAEPAGPDRSTLLWASAASPTGGALHLAEAEAMRVAAEINWTGGPPADAPAVPSGPLTPPLLSALLTAGSG